MICPSVTETEPGDREMTEPKPPKVVTYRRVSTARQGQSGLGLEGQEAAIAQHVRATGGTILASYLEVESGKRSDRPELARALAHAKRAGATLVIAKLDRLSRNVAFLSALMESRVAFVACDNPHATALTLHILAAVAEDEVKRISERTKVALRAAKGRGVRLGGHRDNAHAFTEADRVRAGVVAGRTHAESAEQAYSDLAPRMLAMRTEGLTYREIADRLNGEGHETRRHRPWSKVQVMRVVKRAGYDQAPAATT
jgi:DNA invertase Pin-like site-specific DNA recombinase